MRQTIVLDFDGVIHSYTSGWKGIEVIPDPPTNGAREAIEIMRQNYEVVVVSSRCSTEEGRQAVQNWLIHHKILVDRIMAEKPPHVVVVDDRAIRFEGNWADVLLDIPKASIPWNKKTS